MLGFERQAEERQTSVEELLAYIEGDDDSENISSTKSSKRQKKRQKKVSAIVMDKLPTQRHNFKY